MKLIIINFLLILFCPSNLLAQDHSYFSEDGLFIKGYDPVSYIKSNSAQKGEQQYSTEYNGIKILFVSQANKDLFLKDPQVYLPAYNGWCAYAMNQDGSLVEIDPLSFKVINGRTYLFYNGFWANTLKKWNELLKNSSESSLIKRADENWASKSL